MNKKIVVFCGAGASCAVDSQQYPTTLEFFKRLSNNQTVASDRLFNTVVEFIRDTQGITTIDVEHLLWELGELEKMLESFTSSPNLFGFLMRQNRIGPLSNSNIDSSSVFASCANIAPKVTALKSSINKLVYELYGAIPTKEQLEPNWYRLVRGLSSKNFSIDLVTTNYDRVLEEVVETLREEKVENLPDAGRVLRVEPYLNLELWRSPLVNRGLITKLHGSVDWSRGGDTSQITLGDAQYKGDHGRHVILYPGFKGAPEDEPFATLHSYFENVLMNASAIVVIGFAFRDAYINQLFQKSASKGATLFQIDLAEEGGKLPFAWDGHYNYIGGGFSSEAVDALLHSLEENFSSRRAA